MTRLGVFNVLVPDDPTHLTVEPFVYEGRPQRIIFGPGRLAEAPDVVERHRRHASAGAFDARAEATRLNALRVRLARSPLALFPGAVMHTPVEVTEKAIGVYQSLKADCVVSVGGGSTTGLGKAIALRNDAPQLVIPTTYAGSEVTNLLGETAGGEKKTQRSPKILPEAVIYDVELTLSLPPKLSATSGMNAMAHAVEALYAKDNNPITSMMAEEGLRAFASSLQADRRGPERSRCAHQCAVWRLALRHVPRRTRRSRSTTSSAMCSAARSTCRTPRRMRSCCRMRSPTTRRRRLRR